jgi:hypothetical protein
MRHRLAVPGHRPGVGHEPPDVRTLDRALADGVSVDGRPELLEAGQWVPASRAGWPVGGASAGR